MKKNRNLELLKGFLEGRLTRAELKREIETPDIAPIAWFYPEDRINPEAEEVAPGDIVTIPGNEGDEKITWKAFLERYKGSVIPSPIAFMCPTQGGLTFLGISLHIVAGMGTRINKFFHP